MKILKTLLGVFILIIFLISCKENCLLKSKGTLKLTNTSSSTVMRSLVDGVNHGTLDPGESIEIDLGTGVHAFIFEGISGGAGCSPGTVTIVACETSAFTCSG
ncbi:MAG TPA: hypothetical protein VGA21_08975 [Cyclobacteriaceae bacterium]|jgi:hypothetical protein